jgi:hypothetical protein
MSLPAAAPQVNEYLARVSQIRFPNLFIAKENNRVGQNAAASLSKSRVESEKKAALLSAA